MRQYLLIYVNNQRYEISDAQGNQSLSDFLRNDLDLVGTKVVCAEGDCGSCTVLIAKVQAGELCYLTYNSCIQYLYQLDCAHIVTVEGLKQKNVLHPAQQVMVDALGSQCGYCTPGFVMSLTGMLENNEALNRKSVLNGLTGNLCRCTGYEQIVEAALLLNEKSTSELSGNRMSELFDLKKIVSDFTEVQNQSVLCEFEERWNGNKTQNSFFIPTTLREALDFKKKNQNVTVVSGGTDISVQINKERLEPNCILSLAQISELSDLYIENQKIIVGAKVNLSELGDFCQQHYPQLAEIISIFASPQIKHAGTLAGNIVNASPIADSLPFLYVVDAELELSNSSGSRWININQFYQGYKKMDLTDDELLTRIRWQIPESENDVLKLYKVSKRKDLDISTFTAGIFLKLKGQQIESARLAYGGVGPNIICLSKTEAYLSNKELSADVFNEAGKIAKSEIAPISDVRASSDYRLQLAENILTKFYYENLAK